jgi:tetratricopeptide (TPR) repeat protein
VAVKKLLSEFSDNRYKPRAIHNTAWEYRKAGRYDKADQLYQYVVDNQSGNEDMMWVKTGIARLNIALGNDAAAEKTIDILIADFNDHPELPTAIFILGEEYYNEALFLRENEGLYEQAKKCYQKAVVVWERIVAELPQSESTDTAHAYYFSAVCYWHLGEYQKPIEYCQKIVDTWPDYRYIWHVKRMIDRCSEEIEKSRNITK